MPTQKPLKRAGITSERVPAIDPRWKFPPEQDDGKPEPWVCSECGKTRNPQWNLWSGEWTLYTGPCEICESAAFREESLLRARENVLHKYGLVGGEYGDMSFDSYHPDPKHPSQDQAKRIAMGVVEEWKAGNWSKGLLLASANVGVGKTHLAIAVAREGVQLYRGDRILSVWGVSKLLKSVRDSYNNGGPAELMATVTESGIVVLDDLGIEHFATESWYIDIMYEIFNARWLGHKATVVTTNKGGTELRQRLGNATMSRLLALVGDPVTMTGEDYRKKKRG